MLALLGVALKLREAEREQIEADSLKALRAIGRCDTGDRREHISNAGIPRVFAEQHRAELEAAAAQAEAQRQAFREHLTGRGWAAVP